MQKDVKANKLCKKLLNTFPVLSFTGKFTNHQVDKHSHFISKESRLPQFRSAAACQRQNDKQAVREQFTQICQLLQH